MQHLYERRILIIVVTCYSTRHIPTTMVDSMHVAAKDIPSLRPCTCIEFCWYFKQYFRLFAVDPSSRSIGNLSLTARRDDAVAHLTFEFMRVCVVFVFRTASPRYRQLVCVSTKICPAKQSANSEEALRCVFQCGS